MKTYFTLLLQISLFVWPGFLRLVITVSWRGRTLHTTECFQCDPWGWPFSNACHLTSAMVSQHDLTDPATGLCCRSLKRACKNTTYSRSSFMDTTSVTDFRFWKCHKNEGFSWRKFRRSPLFSSPISDSTVSSSWSTPPWWYPVTSSFWITCEHHLWLLMEKQNNNEKEDSVLRSIPATEVPLVFFTRIYAHLIFLQDFSLSRISGRPEGLFLTAFTSSRKQILSPNGHNLLVWGKENYRLVGLVTDRRSSSSLPPPAGSLITSR